MSDGTRRALQRLYGIRRARAVFGAALIGGAAALLYGGFESAAYDALGLGWGGAVALYAAARLLARARAPLELDALRDALDQMGPWSARLPLIGLSLLAPLSLHALFTFATDPRDSDFSRWVVISAAVVGHAHLTLAWNANKHAPALLRAEPERGLLRVWGRALGWTVLAAALPGVILLAVPPALTLITGLAFVPLMFYAIQLIGRWERAQIAWLAMAERRGLAVSARRSGLPELTGVIDGHEVTLAGRWSGRRLALSLRVRSPSTRRIRVAPRAGGEAAGLRLGDPIADRTLRIDAPDPDDAAWIQTWLKDPDRYAALMEVVHGEGGSVEGGQIRIELQALDIHALEAPLAEALRLADALAEAPALPAPSEIAETREIADPSRIAAAKARRERE